MKKIVLSGIAVLAISCAACTLPQNPSSNITGDGLDFEPTRRMQQLQASTPASYSNITAVASPPASSSSIDGKTFTQVPSSNIIETDLDFEPTRQILQFQNVRGGYYLQFAKKSGATMEWCQDTVVEQKALMVEGNRVGRVCLEADHRYYLD